MEEVLQRFRARYRCPPRGKGGGGLRRPPQNSLPTPLPSPAGRERGEVRASDQPTIPEEDRP